MVASKIWTHDFELDRSEELRVPELSDAPGEDDEGKEPETCSMPDSRGSVRGNAGEQITGLGDAAFGKEALAVDEARASEGTLEVDVRGGTTVSLAGALERDSKLRTILQKLDCALSEVENGSRNIDDFSESMYFAITTLQFGLVDRYSKLKGPGPYCTCLRVHANAK